MADSLNTSQLNRLVVDLGRSLLQYLVEVWPWASPQARAKRDSVIRLADLQRRDVAHLVEILQAEGSEVEFGTYPLSYTDLHYVDLDFMMQQLIDNQQALVDELQSASASIGEAAESLEEVLEGESFVLAEMRKLAQPKTESTATS